MLRLVSLVVALAGITVVTCFAVANRDPVTVSFWPLPLTQTQPLFAVVLVALVAGVLLGGIATWLAGWSTRTRARRAERRAIALEARERLRREQAEEAELARRRERRAQLTAAAPAG